jgi:hypothetical protein
MNGTVLALIVHEDGDGRALIAGGEFTTALDSGDGFVARWGYTGIDLDPPMLDCPSSVLVLDEWSGPPGEVVSFTVSAIDCRDLTPTVQCVPASGSPFPRGTTLVTCTATDASGNQSTLEFPVTVAPKARPR